ncbi:MAG: M15 family metallopeptidase [Hyphomonadaceae bacterium]|nr:M15 family metallopeptidase [Hyphomonadaceae bacterium]
MKALAIAALVGLGLATPAHAHGTHASAPLPDTWVNLARLDPTIRMDIRYATANNFTGRRVPGYGAPRCLLARPAADALVTVQRQLAATGETLVIFDCYRPAHAVTAFNTWVGGSTGDNRHYYPGLARNTLIERGYIAARSGHSRGYTVDLAIGPARAPRFAPRRSSACGNRSDRMTLDFGTPFDCFHPSSGIASRDVPASAIANRQRLAALMDQAGFAGYAEEWWHFTLRARPDDAPWLDFSISQRQ